MVNELYFGRAADADIGIFFSISSMPSSPIADPFKH